LKGQFAGISDDMLSQMVISSQSDCVRAYLADIFEIATLVIVLTLSTMTAGELSNKTFIFPVCSNKKFYKLILAKILVYGVFILLTAIVSVLVDHVYAGMLFGTDMPDILPVLRSGVFQGIYYVFVLGIVMFSGVLFRKPITAGLFALIPAYGTHIVSDLFDIQSYTPSGLLREAGLMSNVLSSDILQMIIITAGLTCILIMSTVIRLKKLELARK